MLTDAAFDRPVRFTARLTNPKPTGLVTATGQFGPWAADQPSASAISGSYEFAHADLDTIKGIDGTLESKGDFAGALDQIDVKGHSTTPDFSLDIGGTPLPLSTTFVALVDGTNGDTILHDVDARLAGTPIKAKGGILHTPGRKGRTVVLHATIDKGQLPDVLRLALDDKEPIMDGLLSAALAAQPAVRARAVSSTAWSSTASSPSSSCDLPATPCRTRWTTSAAAAAGAQRTPRFRTWPRRCAADSG